MQITARTTARLRGRRIYRTHTFQLALPHVERDFIPAGESTPAQARIWVVGPLGVTPELVLLEDVPADLPERSGW